MKEINILVLLQNNLSRDLLSTYRIKFLVKLEWMVPFHSVKSGSRCNDEMVLHYVRKTQSQCVNLYILEQFIRYVLKYSSFAYFFFYAFVSQSTMSNGKQCRY